MKKYKFSFIGREAGAIGITHPISTTIETDTLPQAIEKLYAKYDLNRNITVNGKPLTFDMIKFEGNKCIAPINL